LLPLDRGAGGIMFTALANPDDPKYANERKHLVVAVHGSMNPDMAGVAAPVFDDNNDVAGVLTISGPTSRFDDESMESFIKLLLKAAAKLTASIGGDTRRLEKALALAEIRAEEKTGKT